MNNTTLETHPTVNACPWCGKEITQGGRGRPRKFCSRTCSNKYWYQASRVTAPQCNKPGCSKPVQARGMCGSHYSTWHRTEGGKEQAYTCAGCGIEYMTRRKLQREKGFCTRDCQRAYIARDEQSSAKRRQTMIDMGLASPVESKECANCKRRFLGTAKGSKYCSSECSGEYMRKLALESRSPLRKAYEDGTPKQVLDALKELSTITKDGCWEWRRLDKSGYTRVAIGKKDFLVHRLSLEMKHDAPLGSQAAHHICANTKCINPEHLQPVTHRENTAEMLARHSYLDRIAELEEAIKEIAPNHEVLDRVPLK